MSLSADLSEIGTIAALSLRVSLTALLISGLCGIPLGVWMGVSRRRPAVVLRWATQLGMALPPVVVGLALYLLLSRSGPLGSLGWLYTARAMIAAQTVLALPFVMGITAASIAAIPMELREQLVALGASKQQITLTLIAEARSGILLAVAAAFGRSISEVGAVLMVGGNIARHTRVLTTAIVLETSKGEFALALALAAVLLAIAGAINWIIIRYQGPVWIHE